MTGRFPKRGDAERILSWRDRKREYFAAHADEALKVAGKKDDSASRASWTMVANVLLNLDEAITKE